LDGLIICYPFFFTHNLLHMLDFKSIIFILAGLIAGSTGTLYISKAVKPQINLECPKCPQCPQQMPCNSIDYEKLKGRHITVNNQQTLIARDTITLKAIRNELREELKDFKARRCK
jgi:hypothetical protein